ncbi:MAG TPA: hypothetical protein VK604_09485 [Bryobacteraceae bacterium]|nr:hypothetical protein [Bryobacteraceae bacterium]
MDLDSKPPIDAKTFVEPLASLAETMAQKVHREAFQYLSAPKFVSEDIFMMMRLMPESPNGMPTTPNKNKHLIT